MGWTSPTVKLYRDTYQDSSGNDWDEIAELNSVSFPDKSREVVDLTHLNATNRYRIFKTGFRDAGRVVFNINYTDVQYRKLNDDYERDDSVYYRIVLSDSAASEFVFEGFIVRLSGTVPEGSGKLSCDCEIKLTGEPDTEPS